MNIPTAHSTQSLERFLHYIQTTAPPTTPVSRQYLEAAGFTSGNDPELKHIARLLGFLDDQFVATKFWKSYQENGNEELVLAIRKLYQELFELFPDPTRQTDSELMVWFRPPRTGETPSSVQRAIRTFRKLCVFAGISPDNRVKPEEVSDERQLLVVPDIARTSPQIIFQVPPLTDKSAYKMLLEAIKEVFYV